MRARRCKRIYYIIPDGLGLRIDVARVPQDWSLTGYVARTIGRVWK